MAAPEADSDVKGVVLPIAPFKKTLPVPADNINGCAPLTEPESVMSPAPAPVLSVVGPLKDTLPAKEMFWLLVVMLSPKRTGPAPV